MTVTKMSYFVDSDNKPVYPSLTLTPDPNSLVSTATSSIGTKVQLYTGKEMHSVDSCYKLFVYEGNQEISKEKIQDSLVEAWNATKDCM